MVNNKKERSLPQEEKLLFSLVAEGDEKAFGALFNMFLPRLYPFIIKFTRSEQAAQEIIQETFIRIWLNRDKLDDIKNPAGWLFKVATNECYNYLRKSVLNNNLFDTISSEPDATDDATQEWLDVKELKMLVNEAVNKLPVQRKKIFQMSREQGKSIPEIAAALQISPHTVKNTLVISLKFIREYLIKHGIILFLFMLLFGKK